MKKYIYVIMPIFLLASCTAGMKAYKKEVKSIDEGFSGKFMNNPYKSEDEGRGTSILKMFHAVGKNHGDTIHLEFINSKQLLISFTDTLSIYQNKTKQLVIEGRFKRKGYFEAYLRREWFEIPPFISLIYGKRNIDRVRLYVLKNDNSIICNKWLSSGNILLMAARSSGREQCFYQQIVDK